MSKSELLSSAVTVLSLLITLGTLGAKLISLLEKLKAGQNFLREEVQEMRIDMEQRLECLDKRLRALETAGARQISPSIGTFPHAKVSLGREEGRKCVFRGRPPTGM